MAGTEDLSIICQTKPVVILRNPLDVEARKKLFIEQIDRIEKQAEEISSIEKLLTSWRNSKSDHSSVDKNNN